MREILFRGKKENGRWIEGDLIHYESGEVAILEKFTKYGFEATEIHRRTKVLSNTICQFTGLTDKNGTNIYEGDIVKSEFTRKPYLVCFGEYTYTDEYGEEENVCGWYNKDEDGYVTGFGSPDSWATVIGNIHDNPELLGGAE